MAIKNQWPILNFCIPKTCVFWNKFPRIISLYRQSAPEDIFSGYRYAMLNDFMALNISNELYFIHKELFNMTYSVLTSRIRFFLSHPFFLYLLFLTNFSNISLKALVSILCPSKYNIRKQTWLKFKLLMKFANLHPVGWA